MAGCRPEFGKVPRPPQASCRSLPQLLRTDTLVSSGEGKDCSQGHSVDS